MFHGLWLIIALILAVSMSLYLVVMAVLVTAYLLFCGPQGQAALLHEAGFPQRMALLPLQADRQAPGLSVTGAFFIPETGLQAPG